MTHDRNLQDDAPTMHRLKATNRWRPTDARLAPSWHGLLSLRVHAAVGGNSHACKILSGCALAAVRAIPT